MKVSGVYEIVHLPTGRRYIGSAVHYGKRKKLHLCQLRNGKHHNRHLQNAWHKYGEDQFKFNLLLVCARDMVLFYEQRCIDGFAPEFNVAPTAGSALGVKHGPEFCQNLSKRARERRAKYDWNGEKKSLVEIAEDLGWEAKVLHNRVLTQKKTLDEAIAMGPEMRAMNEKFEYNGRSQTRDKWARELDMHPRRLNYWLAQGLTIAQCIDRLDKNEKRMTLPEFCRQFGVSDKTVKSRRKKGMSLMEAVTVPIVQRDNSWREAKWPTPLQPS